MKCVISLLSALLLTQMIYAFPGEINITSVINRVKVFRQGAQVTRTARANIPIGETILRFSNLSANLESRTIQLKSDGDFTILSVNYETNYLNETKEAAAYRQLEMAQDSLQTLIEREQVTLQVLTEGENFLLANKEVAGNTGIAVDQLSAALDYQQGRLAEIKLKKLDINTNIKILQTTLEKIKNQLKNVKNQGRKVTGEVFVKILAKAATTGNFELSYAVTEASWTPEYDIRVMDVSKPLELTYKAKVSQNTGEDWNKVLLTLSSGAPFLFRFRPTLEPWRLKLFEPGSIIQYDTVTTFDPETYEEPVKIIANEIDIPQVNQKENATTFDFQIESPYDIPADNKDYTVSIKKHDIPVYYEYYTAPKEDPIAFLKAYFTNWEQYNLLEGAAYIYFEEAFIGTSTLNADITLDTLSLSLGWDENIVITRNIEKQFTDNQFIGNKKTETYGWNIELRNKKSQKVNIVVEDQYPLSTNEAIEVTLDNAKGAEVNKEEGLLKWKLNMEPGKAEKLNFRYSVKYPKKQRLVLE